MLESPGRRWQGVRPACSGLSESYLLDGQSLAAAVALNGTVRDCALPAMATPVQANQANLRAALAKEAKLQAIDMFEAETGPKEPSRWLTRTTPLCE